MGEDENEVKEISEEEYEYGFGAEAREDTALEAAAKALAEGEARGKAEGIAENKNETARNLLHAGIDIAVIAQCTGLTEKQILSL